MGDPVKEAAQKRLAALLVSFEVQVAFNLKKGSFPVRGDIHGPLTSYCTVGLAAMVQALMAGRHARCSRERALHGVDVMMTCPTSGGTGKLVTPMTT